MIINTICNSNISIRLTIVLFSLCSLPVLRLCHARAAGAAKDSRRDVLEEHLLTSDL